MKQLSMFEAAPAVLQPIASIPLKIWGSETDESAEGRELLKLITDIEPIVIHNNYAPWQICAWLEEMGYCWNGGSWIVSTEQGVVL